MRLANPDSVIELAGSTAVDEASAAGVRALADRGYVVFRIGRLRLGEDASEAIARGVVAAIRDRLVVAGAPAELSVEAGEPQATIMPPNVAVRNMLPHHDGQHASYLTPSTTLVPDWDPADRIFADHGFTTTHSHKLYQSIFIQDPGDGLSVTTHLNLVRVLRDAATTSGRTELPEIADWYAGNLRALIRSRSTSGSSYPTLAGMLGTKLECLVATPLLREEAPIPAEQLARYPELDGYRTSCPCGDCEGETRRVFCHVVTLALGIPVAEFFEKYRTDLVSEQFDLLMTNNLTSMHGGLAGGKSRVLHPVYLSVRRPSGAAYEDWLTAAWRSALSDS